MAAFSGTPGFSLVTLNPSNGFNSPFVPFTADDASTLSTTQPNPSSTQPPNGLRSNLAMGAMGAMAPVGHTMGAVGEMGEMGALADANMLGGSNKASSLPSATPKASLSEKRKIAREFLQKRWGLDNAGVKTQFHLNMETGRMIAFFPFQKHLPKFEYTMREQYLHLFRQGHPIGRSEYYRIRDKILEPKSSEFLINYIHEMATGTETKNYINDDEKKDYIIRNDCNKLLRSFAGATWSQNELMFAKGILSVYAAAYQGEQVLFHLRSHNIRTFEDAKHLTVMDLKRIGFEKRGDAFAILHAVKTHYQRLMAMVV